MTSFRLLPLLAAATICTAAQAADLSGPAGSGGYKDGPAYGPTWTGFYIGAHGGYGSGDWTGNLTYTDGPSGFPGSRTVDANGWFGGGQVGYNKQIGTIVIGIEADIAATDFQGKGTFAPDPSYGYSTIKHFSNQLDYLGTVRGRLGYSMGHFMPYVTGGLAYGHTHMDNSVYDTDPSVVGISATGSADEMHVGWTAGAGLEVALSSNWSVKGEWLYTDLGSADYRITGTVTPIAGGGAFNTDGFRSDLTFNSFKAGINYRFNDAYAPLK